MAVRYITIANVRTTVGIDSTAISDGDVTEMTEDVEFQIERFLNTTFTPKEEIDILDGSGKPTIFTSHSPLLAVRSLADDGTSLTVGTDVEFTQAGRIRTTSDSPINYFTTKNNGVIIEYLHGWRIFPESGGTETTTSAAATAGTTVSLTVGSISGFSDNDWIEIYGTDGNREVAQIGGSPTGTTIIVDEINYSHVSGSLVRLLEVPNIILRLMKISSALALVARIIGDSADDIVGYTMGEFQVQKGEPFTQWRETARQLIAERDRILAKVQPRLAMGM